MRYQVLKYLHEELIRVSQLDYVSLDKAKEQCELDCKATADNTRCSTMLQYIIFSIQEDGSKIAVELHTATAQPRTNRCEK